RRTYRVQGATKGSCHREVGLGVLPLARQYGQNHCIGLLWMNARFPRIDARDIQRVIFCRDDVNRDNIDSPTILTHSEEKDVTGSIITDKNKIGNEVRASSSYTNSQS
ncbi:hypothetical protein ACSV5M_21860, partial [Cellvibrio sp. ARAG 10.3]|uniref:hypothetical protein n=1 Tax=Cellvibrio sp. ARAG 10.3 TaxID=3451358 RepID=UPI003F48238E